MSERLIDIQRMAGEINELLKENECIKCRHKCVDTFICTIRNDEKQVIDDLREEYSQLKEENEKLKKEIVKGETK